MRVELHRRMALRLFSPRPRQQRRRHPHRRLPARRAHNRNPRVTKPLRSRPPKNRHGPIRLSLLNWIMKWIRFPLVKQRPTPVWIVFSAHRVLRVCSFAETLSRRSSACRRTRPRRSRRFRLKTSRTPRSTSNSWKQNSVRLKNFSGSEWGGGSGVEGRLYVGSAVAIKAGGRDGLGKDDSNGDEDGAAARSERHGHFHARAFRVLIAAAEADAAFGQILANDDFFLKAAPADASEYTRLDAGAIAAWNDAILDGG